MRKLVIACVTLAMLALAACGNTTEVPANEVLMTASNFVTKSLTVKAGTTVVFDDPVSASYHILYTGSSSKFESEAGAPDALEDPNGIPINPGEKLPIVFATPGTYTITCSIHPIMNLTITVTP